MVYRLHGDSIEIIYVLESKMGGATFSESQANGYFERWQTRGIYVYGHRGEIVHFKPKNIRFKTNSIEIDVVERIDVSNHLSDTFQGYQTIDSMSFTQFLSYTVNAGSEKHKSRLREFGEYLQTTMNTKQAKQISENYGRFYFDTKNKNSSGKKKIKNKPKKNNDKWMEPVEFSLALKKWFWDQKDAGKIVWPSPSKSIGGVNGGLLRENIEHYGSSTQVFIHHTSTKTKILLASKGSLPVAHHLEFKLMNADTPSHGLKDAFLIYMNVLETNGGELAVSKLSRIKANYERVFHDSQDNCNLKFREGTKI